LRHFSDSLFIPPDDRQCRALGNAPIRYFLYRIEQLLDLECGIVGRDIAVPPVNFIVQLFWSLFAIAIRLQFCRIDGAGHQHGETPQTFPTPSVQ